MRSTLAHLRCIQLDPLDPMGTNADLVLIARVKGASRGSAYRSLYPGHAFEHFAKERCILPASAFPYYRDRAVETPWWRHSERMKRLDRGLVDAVLAEVSERGPVTARQLEHRGKVEPIDWSGWKSTSSATKLALDILWTRCDVVIAGKRGREKLFDVPARALPSVADVRATGDFESWALRERVEAAGLLAKNGGPWWSMISDVRTGPVPGQMVDAGELEDVVVAGRAYLAPKGFLERPSPRIDDEMRILGPLDPVVWNRALVRDVFAFDYIWEVYKPAEQRRWGWYVSPLYHRGWLVGRIEGAVNGTTLVISRLWREPGHTFDEDALDRALERHAVACGCGSVKRGPGARRRRA